MNGFKDAQDGQLGVWTDGEKAAEAARRDAAQAAAKAQAEASMAAAINAITSDATLSTQQKRRALRLLQPSGHSEREWSMSSEAEEALENE
jgi:hypothetical protein